MEVLKRVLSAVVMIPISVLLIFWPGGLPFAIAIGIIAIWCAHEFYTGVRKLGANPVELLGLLAVAMFVVSARNYEIKTISAIFPAVLTLLFIISFCVELVRKNRAPLVNVGATVFGSIYVGWLIMHLVVLRSTHGLGDVHGKIIVGGYSNDATAWLVMMAFICTWASDTGAFFIGKFFGKKKIAPNLSPNKTLEGCIGGFAGAIISALIVGYIIRLPLHHALALGVLMGVLCQLGDLSESAIKREIGIKDFGKALPGHGGVLDRMDSMLFTGPAMYYYVALFLMNWKG
ncbi:MAG: phosphatidate cytidylyltransferase [Armatimonadetes bacterium]|nr:phosphatidate cytidylyltransferase [Armatimonadota bacterium]